MIEVREIGEKVKAVALGEVPTLVKYAEAAQYLVETPKDLDKFGDHEFVSGSPKSESWCVLIDHDPEGEKKVLAAALYHAGEMPFHEALACVRSMGEPELNKLADTLLLRLGEHDIPLRELELTAYTFDLVMDQGAYAEFKRHRMMTQTPQRLTTLLGYETPRLITESGLGAAYEKAMAAAAETFNKLYRFNPQVAQYIVPNGYRRRVLACFNLREAYAFCQLRSARNAHFSIRRVAERMYEELKRVHPLLTKYMHLPEETWQAVEQKHFS